MPNDNASIEHGILVRQWKWPLRMVFWWVMIGGCVWIYAVSAQCFWAWRAAPQAMLPHVESVLERDLAALEQLEPGLFEPAAVAGWIHRTLVDSAIGATTSFARTLMDWPARFRAWHDKRPGPADAGGDFVRGGMASGDDTLRLIVVGSQIFAIRTAMFTAAAPLLALGLALAVVDGLVARALRKACAGRESGSLYHRAKLGASFVAILGFLLCLGLPTFDRPSVLLVPIAIAVAWAVRTQCAYYKKYL